MVRNLSAQFLHAARGDSASRQKIEVERSACPHNHRCTRDCRGLMYNNLVVAHFCFIYSRSERHPPVGGGVVAPAVCANAFIIIFSAASSSPSSSSSSSSSLRSRGKVDGGRVRVRKLFQGHIFSSRASLVPLLPLLLPWLLHHPPTYCADAF